MRSLIFIILSLSILLPLHSIAAANEPMATGIFGKGSTHGHVKIHQKNDKWFVTFGADFIHDGSPDPWIALGKDGFQRSGIIGELQNFKGPQSFLIEKLDPTQFNEVYVWCVQHNSSLGRAKITWQ